MTQKRKNRITIRLTDEEKNKLEKLAEINKVTLSEFIRSMVFSYINLCGGKFSNNFSKTSKKIDEIESAAKKTLNILSSLKSDLYINIFERMELDLKKTCKESSRKRLNLIKSNIK